ncbi:MAG: iron-containing redox enzyme family protein [Acidimicrobiales bacterium]
MLRHDLDSVLEEALRHRLLLEHPFYRRWEAGELDHLELAAYAGQYRHFEQALPGVLETIVSRIDDPGARAVVQANLDDERAVPSSHLSLFDEFAEAVGADTESPPAPATSALGDLYRSLADGGPAGAMAALAAYEVQAPAIAVSKAEGLRARYGLTAADTVFWDVHGDMDAHHASWTLDALAVVAGDAAEVRAPARAAAQAWWAFLDERQAAAVLPATC